MYFLKIMFNSDRPEFENSFKSSKNFAGASPPNPHYFIFWGEGGSVSRPPLKYSQRFQHWNFSYKDVAKAFFQNHVVSATF